MAAGLPRVELRVLAHAFPVTLEISPHRLYEFVFLFARSWFGYGLSKFQDTESLVHNQRPIQHCLIEVSSFPITCIYEDLPKYALRYLLGFRRLFDLIGCAVSSRLLLLVRTRVFLTLSLTESECILDVPMLKIVLG